MEFRTKKSTLVKILVGLFIILFGFGILYYSVGNQWNELSLIRRGQPTPGYIISCTEKRDVDGYPYHYCDYRFTLPDGKTFKKRSITMSGSLKAELVDLKNPYPIEIEYLADNPEISKIKGTGSTNLFNWTLHTFGAVIIAFGIFAFAGILILAEGIKESIKP